MLLASEKLSTLHVSTHVLLREAIDRVTPERVIATVEAGHDHLVSLGVAAPFARRGADTRVVVALEHLEALLSPAVPAQGRVLRDAEVCVEGVSPSNVILRVCAAYFRIWLNPVPVSRP